MQLWRKKGFLIRVNDRAFFFSIQALLKALGDRKGIRRFGDFSAPLDEALVHVVLVSLLSDLILCIVRFFFAAHTR